jgi:hypothetical protein
MKKFFDSLQSLSSIALSGDRQSGKLTLAFYFALQLTQKPVTLISSFNKSFFNKKIKANLDLTSNLQPILKQLDYFNLKEDWKLLKNQYGYGFLLKDIEKVISQSNDVVIIHRIDDFFEIQDRNDIEDFLYNLISIGQAQGKVLIFTVNMGHNNARYIYEYFEKNIDSEFVISKRMYEAKAWDVELVSSLYSTEHSKFSFEFYDTKNEYQLTPISHQGFNERRKQMFQVVLASQSPELADIVRYLFGGEDFDLRQIEPNIIDMMNVMTEEPHLIIFNPPLNLSDSEFKKINKLVANNSHRKVVFVSPQPFIRSQDKSLLLQSGYLDVHEKDFHVESFVLSVERILSHSFYSAEMEKVPDKTYIIHDQKSFSRFIVAFLCKNLFFTVFKFKYQSPLSEQALKSNMGRAFDVAYVNKEEQLVFVFLVNTLARNALAIEEKFKEIDNRMQLIGFKDATKYSIDYLNQDR